MLINHAVTAENGCTAVEKGLWIKKVFHSCGKPL